MKCKIKLSNKHQCIDPNTGQRWVTTNPEEIPPNALLAVKRKNILYDIDHGLKRMIAHQYQLLLENVHQIPMIG